MPDLHTVMTRLVQEAPPGCDPAATLHTLVRGAAEAFPEFDHVGVTIAHKDGRVESAATTDDLAGRLDRLQYDLAEGPCLHAISDEPVVRVPHAPTDARWPRFMAEACQWGLRSQLGLRLYSEAESAGALNLYSTTTESIGEETVHLAEVFAAYTSLALGKARREKHLEAAIGTRQLIGQATGILMERYATTETRAFEYLVRLSSHTHIKLRDVAEELVTKSNLTNG